MKSIQNGNNIITLSDGRKLGFAEYGDPQGKPLFFFHGWPSSRLQGQMLDDSAKKLHVRVISPDRPGYGLSDFQEDRTLLDWPDDIVQLADHLKIKKFAIVGVSGGAPYVAACAYKIPERITKAGIAVGLSPTNVAGVLQGIGLVNRVAWTLYHKFPFTMHLSTFLLRLGAKNYIPDSLRFAYMGKNDKKIIFSPEILPRVTRIRQEAFRQGKRGVARDLSIYTHDWGFDVKDIKVKTFLWYGAADKQVSVEMGRYYASRIPRSELKVYPNVGHFGIMYHAEEIIKKLIT